MEATSAAGIQDQFLNLLTTQLRHQDPLEPTKQEDFIAQLAQFSTLEGIEKLNSNFEAFMGQQADANGDLDKLNARSIQLQQMVSAGDLVGSEVSFAPADTNSDSDGLVTGVVEGVVLENEAVHLRIDGKLHRLENLQEIGKLSS